VTAGRESGVPTWAGAVAVVGIALLARAIEALVDPFVFNDGPRFVAMAVALLAGDWRSALADDFHPLTALAMAAVSRLLGLDLEASGELVNVLAGGVATLAIWQLTREQLGPRVALVAGMIFALHPRLRESSAGVQSDGLHLACFALAALFAWRALEHRAFAAAALAGLCTGLGYLTRPEALVVGVVLAGWLLMDLAQRRLPLQRALALGAVYGITLAVLGAPYVVALHEIDGRWSITHKKDLADWVLPGGAAPATEPAPGAPLDASAAPAPADAAPPPPPIPPVQAKPAQRSELVRDGLRGFHPILLVLAALGLAAILRGEPDGRRAAAYALSFLFVSLALLLTLHLMAGYVSRRHYLPAAALLVPLAGRGTLALSDGIVQRIPRLAAWRAAPALGVAIVLGIFIEMLVPQREPSKLAREDAARWLREHHAPTAVGAHRARDAYYAGATRHVALFDEPPGDTAAMLRSAHARGAQFVILDLEGRSEPGLPPWAHVLHRAEYAETAVLVLEVGP
jgi:hypothetical protein